MRALAIAFALTAIGAQAAPDAWTSREDILTGSQNLAAKLAAFQKDLAPAQPSTRVTAQWNIVVQQVTALEALVKTGASYDESLIQFRSLGSALGEARRLMYEEQLCYVTSLLGSYQAVRLSYRRLDRNMSGYP